MLPIRFTHRLEHFAPLELRSFDLLPCYKHPAPPELMHSASVNTHWLD
jgi:hypothetical protein